MQSSVPDASQELESIAERYAVLAREGLQPRRVDIALRALDLVISALALVLLAPVWLLVAAAIFATSGPPVLYRGLRVGREGRVFTMLKFRTLRPDAESRLGPFYGEGLSR